MKDFFSKLSSYMIIIPIAFFILILLTAYIVLSPYAKLASDAYSVMLPNNAVLATLPPEEANIIPTVTIPPAAQSVENAPAVFQNVKISTIKFPQYQQYYAKLECFEVGLNVKVYWGDTNDVLKKGVGQSLSSYYPGLGKPLLMGGHNKSFLSSLETIQPGNVLKLTTSYGEIQYTVTGIKITAATDAAAFNISQDKEILMLYTCYPFNAFGINAKRFVVYAEKTAGVVIVD